MQRITLQKTIEYPWDDPLLYSTQPHHFLFKEMGLYGIYGSPAWRHTEVLGKAMHHPSAVEDLMKNNPGYFVGPFTS